LTQYYYLVASLPMLFFEGTPPFSSTAWLESCREQLAAPDHALLARISFAALGHDHGDPGVWREYASWEAALRDELARQRAQRLGVSAEPFLRPAPFCAGLPAVVKEALAAGTPKAIEIALDRKRWGRLDELEAGTQFDLGRLVVYRLKLLLLERKDRWRGQPGREAFVQKYARVLDGAAPSSGANGPVKRDDRPMDERRQPTAGYGEAQ
jgi:hypothetical protein